MDTQEDVSANSASKLIQIDEGRIRNHLAEVVRDTVEETLNGLLDAVHLPRRLQGKAFANAYGRERVCIRVTRDGREAARPRLAHIRREPEDNYVTLQPSAA